jgi:hypothetical protein
MLEGHRPLIGDKPIISQKLEEERILGDIVSWGRAIFDQGAAAAIGDMRPRPSSPRPGAAQ